MILFYKFPYPPKLTMEKIIKLSLSAFGSVNFNFSNIFKNIFKPKFYIELFLDSKTINSLFKFVSNICRLIIKFIYFFLQLLLYYITIFLYFIFTDILYQLSTLYVFVLIII